MTQNGRIVGERKLGRINIKEFKISAMLHIVTHYVGPQTPDLKSFLLF